MGIGSRNENQKALYMLELFLIFSIFCFSSMNTSLTDLRASPNGPRLFLPSSKRNKIYLFQVHCQGINVVVTRDFLMTLELGKVVILPQKFILQQKMLKTISGPK